MASDRASNSMTDARVPAGIRATHRNPVRALQHGAMHCCTLLSVDCHSIAGAAGIQLAGSVQLPSRDRCVRSDGCSIVKDKFPRLRDMNGVDRHAAVSTAFDILSKGGGRLPRVSLQDAARRWFAKQRSVASLRRHLCQFGPLSDRSDLRAVS